jgi:Uma2 family endonuclease
MSTVTVMQRDTPWSVEDLQHLPDDGQRYELIDGELLVSAAPYLAHQDAVGACYRVLHNRCSPELKVYVAPIDFQPNRRVSLQPDVLVARRDALGIKNLTLSPILVVEVHSDSTRSKDLINKREAYQRYGVLS